MPTPVPRTTLPDAKEIEHTVRTFAWASFLHDMGADMVFSVWPLFLTNVLGANRTVVGLIDGLGDAIVSISQAVSGALSDRWQRRKPFVWMGYSFGGLARIGYALAPTWHWVIPFRLLDRSGKMRGAPRDAIVSDLSVRGNRGRHFGFMRAMDNAGAVVGVLLSILLLRTFELRTVFLIAAIPSALAALLVIFAIRERSASGVKLFRGMRFTDLSGNLRLYLVLSGIFQLGSFSYSFLLLAAVSLGFQNQTVPILYLLYSLVAAIASIPAGRLADKIGRKPVLLFSFLTWTVVLALLLSGSNTHVLIIAFLLYGLHIGMMEPVQKTLAAELAPKQYVASTLGGFQLVLGLMSFPASFLAGILWDTYGLTAPLLLSLLLTAAAAVLLLFIKDSKK